MVIGVFADEEHFVASVYSEDTHEDVGSIKIRIPYLSKGVVDLAKTRDILTDQWYDFVVKHRLHDEGVTVGAVIVVNSNIAKSEGKAAPLIVGTFIGMLFGLVGMKIHIYYLDVDGWWNKERGNALGKVSIKNQMTAEDVSFGYIKGYLFEKQQEQDDA